MHKTIKIAFVGNPNVGKTTLFNSLTGGNHHVGNWPGKTVECCDANLSKDGNILCITDLPGTYSLSPYSEEEVVARDYLEENKPDCVVQVIDGQSIEKNLFLTAQLIEMQQNLILGINFFNRAKESGNIIDTKKMSDLLGITVVAFEAKDKKMSQDLLGYAIAKSKNKTILHDINYGEEINSHLLEISKLLPQTENKKWLSVKLLEHEDKYIAYAKSKGYEDALKEAEKARRHLENLFNESIELSLEKARHGFVNGIIKECVTFIKPDKLDYTDKIDNVLTHNVFGILFFIGVMFLLFNATFSLSGPIIGIFKWIIELISSEFLIILNAINTPKYLVSFIIDAIIGGVGSIIVFFPNIFLLFFLISFLEDSGYLARVAYIMDRTMHRIGLHGKSAIPMILGFGCSVPAVIASRTLDSKKDKILTMLITPFMSCSAKLPVYMLFASVFFIQNEGLIVFSLYFLGIIISIISGIALNKIFFKGLSNQLVMELPPYRLPTLTSMFIHAWEKASEFVKKAGTIILSAVIVIWFLASLPFGVAYASENSVAGIIGKFIAPIFSPIGFGFWQAAVSLMFGFVAKEVVIGTFGSVYGSHAIGSSIQSVFTPLSAYSFMVFVLLYVPCISTIAAIKKESNSWKWAIFSIVFSTTVAWLVSFIIYQVGSVLL